MLSKDPLWLMLVTPPYSTRWHCLVFKGDGIFSSWFGGHKLAVGLGCIVLYSHMHVCRCVYSLPLVLIAVYFMVLLPVPLSLRENWTRNA